MWTWIKAKWEALLITITGIAIAVAMFFRRKAQVATEREQAAEGRVKRDAVEAKAQVTNADYEAEERLALEAKMASINALARARQDAARAKEEVAASTGDDAEAAAAETIRQMKDGTLK